MSELEPMSGKRLPAPLNKVAGRRSAPPVLDAEFKVVPPLWKWLRDYGWAVGGYIAYCAALWGAAALAAWLIGTRRL